MTPRCVPGCRLHPYGTALCMAQDQEHPTGTAGTRERWSGAGAARSHTPVRLACTGRQSSRYARRKRAMFDFIIQQARLWDGTGHPSVLGLLASRTAASQRVWLRVCCRAAAARMGQGGKEEGQTKAVHSETCGAFRGTTSARYAPARHGVWPACSRYAGRKATYVRMRLQWFTEMSNTRNQFSHRRVSLYPSHAR